MVGLTLKQRVIWDTRTAPKYKMILKSLFNLQVLKLLYNIAHRKSNT